MSVSPTTPIIQAQAEPLLEKLIQEKRNDPNFVQTVWVQVPQVAKIEVCKELQDEYLTQVNALVVKLQDAADMGGYLLNPIYPPA